MNKRFSTLLAAALVAGSSFSVQAASGNENEATLKKSLEKYYQMKTGEDLVVIGHGETRDSLAVWAAKDIQSLEDFNETLWRVEFTPVKAANGQIAQYEMRIFSKVGNRQLILSTALVQPGKTFYKSPAAVLGAEGLDKWTVTKDEYEALSTIADQDFRFIEYLYSKTADKTTKYKLAIKDNVIKLQSIVSDEQKGGKPEFTQDFPTESGVETLAPIATAVEDVYKFDAQELNAKGNDGFTLSFSKDVVSNKYANPFSAYTLHATAMPIYSAAVYKGEYAEALAGVKEAYGQLDDLKAALKGYIDGTDEAITYLKTIGNTGADAAKAGSLIQNQADLDLAGKEVDANIVILADAADVKTKIATAQTKMKAVADVNIAAGQKLAADNAALKEFQTATKAVLDAMDKLIKDTKAKVDAVDKVMQAWMTPANTGATIQWATEDELAALKEFNTANFKTTTTETIGATIATLAEKAVESERDTESSAIDDYYALAIADSTINKQQAYLTVDTNYVANKEQYLTFATDTLIPATINDVDVLVAPLNKNINKYAFKLSAVIDNIATGDSILIDTYAPEKNDNGNYTDVKDGFVKYEKEARVVIRTLGNGREVSVTTDLNTPDEAIKNTKITFSMPPYADFEEGEVFFVKSMKEADKGGFRVVAYDGTYNTTLVKESKVSASVPATQWFVKKADAAAHAYTIANRDKDQKIVNDQKVYVIDAAKRIYTTAAKDTFQVVEIANLKEDKHLGYKYLTNEEQILKSFVLTAKNYANPEAYYLTVGKDSAVVVTPNADEAMSLVVATPTTTDSKLNDESILTRTFQLVTKDKKETYYLTSINGMLYITTKANTNTLKFRRVNDNADEYEVLVNANEGKLSINQDGEGVKVAMGEATSYVFNLAEEVTEIYKNFETEGIKNVIISLDGDEASKVTAVKPFAVIKRTGLELKAATDNDFVLGLDTAYVNRANNYRYAYYITKPIDVEKVGSFDKKAYMVSYNDSIDYSDDTVQYTQDGLTRIGFVSANRVEFGNNDSLAIAMPKATDKDTIHVAASENLGITPATWAFAIESDGVYRLETKADKNGNKYVSYLNGILVLGSKDQAQLFNVNDTDLTPTDNETIATSEVAVIAGEGQVTIANAAGKKVVISNILGQVVANTVIASDNAVIAAPAGVVVVAVEGEEAVKAIVK
ncbi:DUF6383 domain-containing protein [Parabacteroides hominis]|uniref:DUF6383 domain-containing protein n=1 Tax=Parabacteroides hominis TaxID=2763057 RepID=A0ABR7DTY0_9BACT|nr:DUF6383 domain-containing protein [Parabacteroides hominis]MBC5634903.1 hypothetical protein [Parabacteroides hominis]